MARVGVAVVALFAVASVGWAGVEEDRAAVAELDTEYQAAVKGNDVETMARILHPDFVLVTGVGKVFSRQELLDSARQAIATYSHQEEVEGTQTVRVYGDTAVVTACLWIAGTPKGATTTFDYKLWFSDTYVRTPEGWRYAFGQAAQRLAAAP